MRKPAGLILILLYLAGGAGPSAQAQSSDEIARWVEEVTLGPEYGGSGKVCSRWVKTPKLSVFGATSEQQEVVASSLAHLNETLANTPIKRIELLSPNDSGANILVYFAPLRELPRLAKKHGFEYVEGNWGFFWTFWNRHRINRAIVLLASDKLRGKLLRHFTLEEITQSLGLLNDSSIFSDSIFYARQSNTQYLSERDKRLIIFFYNHIQPGAKLRDVQGKFKKHWQGG